MSEQKVRENRLRRMAQRQGLRLEKSRRRDPLALDYQRYALIPEDERYALISENENMIAGGSTGGRFGFTLDEVEAWLSKGPRKS